MAPIVPPSHVHPHVNANRSPQVDKKRLNTVKESIRQGFSWATREGPLCEERKYPYSFLSQSQLGGVLHSVPMPRSNFHLLSLPPWWHHIYRISLIPVTIRSLG